MMSRKFNLRRFLLALACALILAHSGLDSVQASLPIPVTAGEIAPSDSSIQPTKSLQRFIDDVANGDESELVGIFAPYVFAFPIVNQPADQPTWINEGDGILTNFSLAADAGSIGLLAHYEHAGRSFYDLTADQVIYLVYGDGETITYRVKEILYFKATDPDKKSTSFISLADQSEKSQKDVFDLVYSHPGRLVLQTCLVGQSSSTWGRMFVIAEPE